jgi:hypothetical protein
MYYTHYVDKKQTDKRQFELNKLFGLPNRNQHIRNFPETKTHIISSHDRSKPDSLVNIKRNLDFIETKYNSMLENTPVEDMYEVFHIPKHSGGFRKIEAPIPPLLAIQRDLLSLIQDSFGTIHHNAAFAYVQNRSIKNALEVHQANNSRWFLKMDIKNFFGSITIDTIRKMLQYVYPFTKLNPDEYNKLIHIIEKVATIDGRLPQGTPVSPHLTNVLMVPADYQIQLILARNSDSQFFPYTRYADDIIVSGRRDFNWKKIQDEVDDYLEDEYNLKIKRSKTRYGSRNGRNWNLGLMLNKDNNITVGHKTKDRLKATLFNFIQDYDTIGIDVAYHIQGKLSYYTQIEPEYIRGLLKHLEEKHQPAKPIRQMLADKIQGIV